MTTDYYFLKKAHVIQIKSDISGICIYVNNILCTEFSKLDFEVEISKVCLQYFSKL